MVFYFYFLGVMSGCIGDFLQSGDLSEGRNLWAACSCASSGEALGSRFIAKVVIVDE